MDDVGRAVAHVLVDVADRYDLDRRHLHEPEQVALPVPSGPDQADAVSLVILCVGDVRPERAPQHRERRSGGGRGLQKLSAVHAAVLRSGIAFETLLRAPQTATDLALHRRSTWED